jgi:hypothetical protein
VKWHISPSVFSNFHWFCRAAELCSGTATYISTQITYPVHNCTFTYLRLAINTQSIPSGRLLPSLSPAPHHLPPLFPFESPHAMLRASVRRPCNGLLARTCSRSRKISAAAGSRLARESSEAGLRSGSKPTVVVPHASRRSYAMAAEDTNKGVVGLDCSEH